MKTQVSKALFCLAMIACSPDMTPSSEDAPAVDLCERLNACEAQGPITKPTVGQAITVAPSDSLPDEANSQTAHNNLDIVYHAGRLFLAYRTAPSHFASAEATLVVVSTADQISWRYEGQFHEATDLREPRFLSQNGRLFLFYARLGTDRFTFEPGQSRVAEYLAPDQWTPSEDVFPRGFIPWRISTFGEFAYMTGYTGGDSIYSTDASRLEVHWLRSKDGLQWSPVAGANPVIMEGGVSETAFVHLDDGVLLVGRNEAGDDGGFGSRICFWPDVTMSPLRCKDDPRKYDSPLLFSHRGTPYLIGRRNVTVDGHFDQMGAGNLAQRRFANQAAYWQTPKRCALWRVSTSPLAVEHVLDLPTRGDTCFASILPLNSDQFLIYDYRSSGGPDDQGWLDGQSGPTEIYRVTLTFPKPAVSAGSD